MKKTCIWLLVVLFVFSLGVGCSPKQEVKPGGGDEEEANFKPVTLRWAELAPPVGAMSETIIWMTEEIEKRTEGRVKIEVYWDNILMAPYELLRGVMTGATDIGSVHVGYFPSALPTWGVFNTFLTGPESILEQIQLKDRVINEVPAFNAELDRWNQRMISQMSFQPGTIGMTKPITSVQELQGKTVRAPSSWLLAMLEAAGAIPISMPFPEVHTALDRGTLDGMYTSIDSFERFFFDEAANHFIWHPTLWMPQVYIVSINNDVWNSLLEKDQQIILAVGREALPMCAELTEADIERSIDVMIERSDAVVTRLTDAEVEAWKNHPDVLKLPDKWVEDVEKEGIPGEYIMEKILEIMGQ